MVHVVYRDCSQDRWYNTVSDQMNHAFDDDAGAGAGAGVNTSLKRGQESTCMFCLDEIYYTF